MAEKRRDAEYWHIGMYNMSAFSTALGRALSGKKSKAKYMEEPLYEKATEMVDDENLTEEQIKEERSKLLASLMTMQTNFELNHGGGDK